MQNVNDKKQEWDAYVAHALAQLAPILAELGFSVDQEQKQLIGERYLTRPLGGAQKLIIFGQHVKDGKRVVIKAAQDPRGIEEIRHERECRRLLDRIRFAYGTFLSPEEVLFAERAGYAILVTVFIEAKPFLEHSLEEQFDLALRAFKAQEGAHATTSSHLGMIRKVFEEMDGARYYDHVQRYAQDTIGALPRGESLYQHYDHLSDRAIALIRDNCTTLDQYGSFLTHWDFTPQNIRVVGGDIYLLDHTSLRFGNKYEGWARFINFMELYNPPLAQALVTYVRDNRTAEEMLSLKLMRAYRLMELIRYYSTWLSDARGNTLALAEARVAFWTEVLQAVLDEQTVPPTSVEEYKKTRDALRSEDEKVRQQGLH